MRLTLHLLTFYLLIMPVLSCCLYLTVAQLRSLPMDHGGLLRECQDLLHALTATANILLATRRRLEAQSTLRAPLSVAPRPQSPPPAPPSIPATTDSCSPPPLPPPMTTPPIVSEGSAGQGVWDLDLSHCMLRPLPGSAPHPVSHSASRERNGRRRS